MTSKSLSLSFSLSDWVLGLNVYCFSWNVYLGLFWKIIMYNLIWVYYLPPNFYFILFLFCWENAFCLTVFDFLVKSICLKKKEKLITVGFIFEGIMRMRMRCGLWFNWWVIIFFFFFLLLFLYSFVGPDSDLFVCLDPSRYALVYC